MMEPNDWTQASIMMRLHLHLNRSVASLRGLVLTVTLCSLCFFPATVPASERDPNAAEASAEQLASAVHSILRQNCFRCHGQRNQEGSLRLDRMETLRGTADSDALIVVPGAASDSLLWQRINDDQHGEIMPPDSPALPPTQVDTIRRWIDQGAESWGQAIDSQTHWAYRPITRPVPSPASDSHRSPIDLFIGQKLAASGLQSAGPAEKPRWLRRVSLALTGLPPTLQEMDDFAADQSPLAKQTVVQRLLAAATFGERWAVPWLDAARYADSNGFQADQLRDNWAYRDWVVRALNADLPVDRFVIEQLAGDLLPAATLDQRVATGFHRMTTCNVEAGVDPEANRVNQVVDRVNTTATVLLGTTLECAQCHDHKYDPFTQQDYYRLFAYFNNTPLEVKKTADVTFDFDGPAIELPLDPAKASARAEAEQRIAALQQQRMDLTKQAGSATESLQSQLADLDDQLQHWRAERKRLQPDTTLVMVELGAPRETFVMLRGDYQQPGQLVLPGTPALFPAPQVGPETTGSGNRLELARWITAAENPLFARVMVNRWWAELFGTGIVSTLEDFGTQAEPPSHPELLDWLASELIESGWSMKHVLRRIVLSDTFGQDATVTSTHLSSDPRNRWYARGPRFRMSAEMIRDNALAISGVLSGTMYGPPVMPYQPKGFWRSVGRNQPEWVTAENEDRFRRGMYVVWKRAAPYPSFINFDAPDRGACVVGRDRTNTPLQALTLLNDPAYAELALALADRVLAETEASSDRRRVRLAMTLAVARPPTPQEMDLLLELLTDQREMLRDKPKQVSERTRPAVSAMQLRTSDRAELAAWCAVAAVLLNLDETISF